MVGEQRTGGDLGPCQVLWGRYALNGTLAGTRWTKKLVLLKESSILLKFLVPNKDRKFLKKLENILTSYKN